MATNRFVCEICNKGFQRDKNLQLHLRGHNLLWKLKQTCVHHDPSRALGDLTGIKKHFYRKHVNEDVNETDACQPLPLMQVNDDDEFYDGPDHSDYKTVDSNGID